MVAKFRHVTRQIAAGRGVHVAKWLGDGAMLVGVEPMPAIALAARLVAHHRGEEVAVRVGIASGTTLLFDGDDYIGEPVKPHGQLCAAAKPGEILADCASRRVARLGAHSDPVSVHVRGVGQVDGILRLVPAA